MAQYGLKKLQSINFFLVYILIWSINFEIVIFNLGYYGEWDKRSTYHEPWDKHSLYNSSGSRGDSGRHLDSQGLSDAGRPPGRGDSGGADSPTSMMVAPVILSRAKTSSETNNKVPQTIAPIVTSSNPPSSSVK